MKQIISIVLISLIPIFGFCQEKITPRVDERVEIVAISFRLAEAEEYSSTENRKYADDISTYFEKYKDLPLIAFIKESRNTYGLGYDAVMSMALNLEFKNRKFVLSQEDADNLDKRWKKVDSDKFVQLLNQFYKKTNFQDFFDRHEQEYFTVVSEYDKVVLSGFNQDWYSKFYRNKPDENYNIILGIGNGGGNYGVNKKPKNGKPIVYAVTGVWNFDQSGKPLFKKEDYQPTLIHEFNHFFVNSLLNENNKEKIKNSAEKIYKATENDMKIQAYGNWETLVNESIVRASVIRYMIDNHYSQREIDNEIRRQRNRKFLWTEDLVNLLGEYENKRNEYPTLQVFYPKIIEFFNKQGTKIDETVEKFEKNQPKVAKISPDLENNQQVDSQLKDVKITFDRELTGKGVSINYGESGKEHFPLSKFLGYDDGNTSIKLEMDLKPNTEYEFILTGNNFMSKDGFPIKETAIKFKTK